MKNYYYTIAYPFLLLIKHYINFERPVPNPWEIIYVNPSKINHLTVPRFREKPKNGTYVVGGDWDMENRDLELMLTSNHHHSGEIKFRCSVPFENYGMYQSCKEHFDADVQWEKTQFYKWLELHPSARIQNTKNQRIENVNVIFDNIRSNGFKSQNEIKSPDQNILAEIKSELRPADEVQVNISREGDLIMDDGRHRLISAKILNLDEIPVRVRVRHKEWQETRERIAEGEVPDYVDFSHPDIKTFASRK